MKIKYQVLILLILVGFYCSSPSAHILPEKKIVIIITSYNNKDWYIKNLDSACFQFYENYRVIYIDDASIDGNAELVEKYIEEHNLHNKVKLYKNETWLSQMTNHYKAVHMCHDDEIIVHLDGDDWLKHEYVLSYINQLYQKQDIWLTYGQSLLWPDNIIGPSFAHSPLKALRIIILELIGIMGTSVHFMLGFLNK